MACGKMYTDTRDALPSKKKWDTVCVEDKAIKLLTLCAKNLANHSCVWNKRKRQRRKVLGRIKVNFIGGYSN